jgi:hypothetical protein
MEYGVGYEYFLDVVKTLHKCIVPLYRMNKEKGFPEFIGSSVYCKIGQMRLLLSAEHVLTGIYPDKILYPYSDNLIAELTCDGIHKHKNTALDIGIVELQSELPRWMPIASTFFAEFQRKEEYQHLLVGYPASSTKKSYRLEQKIELKGYLTNAADEKEYKRLNKSPTDKLIVTFQKKKVFSRKEFKMTFPNPNGMSGGAVFQFHENTPTQLSLVGIMNEWDTQSKIAIVATRIEKYDEMLVIEK